MRAVERTFVWLGRYRRKDYEATTAGSEDWITSMIHLLLRRLEPR